MIDNKNFKYFVTKYSTDGTIESHRTLTLAEALKYFLILLKNKSVSFKGYISIREKVDSDENKCLASYDSEEEGVETMFTLRNNINAQEELNAIIKELEKYV